MVEFEPPLSVESAPPMFVTAPVVEAPPVVVEFVESAHVVEYVTPAPAVTYAVPARGRIHCRGARCDVSS